MQIAFIGLGGIGARMAANLVEGGHQVTGYDPEAPAPEGVTAAASAAEAVEGADVVMTMLPDAQNLRIIAATVIPAMREGAVLCDCSTVDVDTARAIAADALAAGLHPVDAPFSGGRIGAEEGRLFFMVGGTDEAFNRVLPLLDILGQRVVHCGGSGTGQAAKLINNMMLGVGMIATCEAFALADKLDLDRQKMYEVVSNSSGRNWSLEAYCPAPGIGPKTPADNGYLPGFSSEFMLGDLRMAQLSAQSADADTPMAALAAELYSRFVEEEDGAGKDFSAMLPRFEKRGHA